MTLPKQLRGIVIGSVKRREKFRLDEENLTRETKSKYGEAIKKTKRLFGNSEKFRGNFACKFSMHRKRIHCKSGLSPTD